MISLISVCFIIHLDILLSFRVITKRKLSVPLSSSLPSHTSRKPETLKLFNSHICYKENQSCFVVYRKNELVDSLPGLQLYMSDRLAIRRNFRFLISNKPFFESLLIYYF